MAWLLTVPIFISVASSGMAESGNAGQAYPVALESPDNYHDGIAPGTEPQFVWQETIQHAGASYITVHFEHFDLGPGDHVVIHDAAGGQSYTMSGRGKMDAGTFWAQHVKGDTMIINLYASDEAGGSGYRIDRYAAGYPIDAPAPPPDIQGNDDKSNAVCFASSHTSEYARAKSVARLLINGDTYCTGFLVSTNNHLITNEHCIDHIDDAINTDYEFMAEAPICGTNNFQGAYPGAIFSGALLINVTAGLDYALVRITNGNPAAAYGHLTLADRVPIIGEQIYIPQHPNGRAKEIALYSSHPSDPEGVALVQSINETPCLPSEVSEIGYYADTEGGSSGSPVIANDDHQVVALHHCGGSPNTAIPMSLINREVAPFIETFGIYPRQPVSVGGPAGGPFFPPCSALTLTNNTDGPITWAASTNVSWLEVYPGTGTVASGSSVELLACVNAEVNSFAVGTYTGLVTVSRTETTETANRALHLLIGTTDKFSENFIFDFDMDNRMLTFAPLAFNPFYSTCSSNGVVSFPVDASGSTAPSIGDDDSAQVNFTNGLSVALYGVSYTSLYINSNGNITFDGDDTTFDGFMDVHFDVPRIALLSQDLSPNLAGTVWYKQLSDRVVITFEDVREYWSSNQNSVQAELFTNGMIRLTWLDVDAVSAVAGLSDGGGMPGFFQESDLSAYGTCGDSGMDSDGDSMDDQWEIANGLIVGINDALHDDDSDGWFNWEEFIADTIPSNAASYFMGITNVAYTTNLNLMIYPTSTGRVYDLEWNTNLFSEAWVSASNSVPGTGAGLQFTLTNALPRAAFRSVITLP